MTSIAVYGGTGYAGSAIVKEAARRGHQVTSVSRLAPTETLDGVTYIQSSIDDAASLIGDADVVVLALSPRGENAGTLKGRYLDIARRVEAAGKRLVVIGGFSSLRPAPDAPRIAEGDDLNPLFAAEAREMNSILAALEGWSGNLDWLFVSPAATFGAYAPGEALGHYRTGKDVAIFDAEGKSALSGADFGLAVVDEIEKGAHHRTQVTFAY